MKRAVLVAGEGFPKGVRLRKRADFLRLSRVGKKCHSPHFVVLIKGNHEGQNRLGITVSARVGNAVIRNRIKRVIREFFRRHSNRLVSSQDIVIIARKGAGELSLDEVTRELQGALSTQRSHQR